jgi:hypothetical protein
MILGFSESGTESEVLKLGHIRLTRSTTAAASGWLGYATGALKLRLYGKGDLLFSAK